MRRFAVVVISILASLTSSVGQSTFGSIVGVVHDKTDAVVPNATVQIRDLADNSTHSVTSDQNGSFEFVNLKPSRYEVTVHADGFTDFRVRWAELTARQALRVDVALTIKSQTESGEQTCDHDWNGELQTMPKDSSGSRNVVRDAIISPHTAETVKWVSD
jgi:hypothetical protein